MGATRSWAAGRWISASAARPEHAAAVIARIAAGETVRDVECELRTKSGELRTVIAAVEQIVLRDQPCLLSHQL
jgi:hypothetical protein